MTLNTTTIAAPATLTPASWQEINKRMADRRRRRNDALADCRKAHADDEFSDFAPIYADFADTVLVTEGGEIPWLVEYIERFTRDCPSDRERLRENLQAILAAL